MRTERLDDKIPEPAVRVDGGFVDVLAGFWELGRGVVQGDLEGELFPGERFEPCYAVSRKC